MSHNVLTGDVDSKGDAPKSISYLTNAPSKFTLVHIAMKNGWFKLVNDVMVDRLHFDVNFYKDCKSADVAACGGQALLGTME